MTDHFVDSEIVHRPRPDGPNANQFEILCKDSSRWRNDRFVKCANRLNH